MNTQEHEGLEGAALVCLSGGQDSTFCLYWAKSRWKHVVAVTFQYHQIHWRELSAAQRVAGLADVPTRILDIPALAVIGGGALTSFDIRGDKPHPQFQELPGSFVPLRNLILFSTAAAYALKLGVPNLMVGVSQTDYSGYPDCRQAFIDHLTATIQVALGKSEPPIQIWTPLMRLSKSEMVKRARQLPGVWTAWAYTHTCYRNEFPPCGRCQACELRAVGFEEAGEIDPLVQRIENQEPKNV